MLGIIPTGNAAAATDPSKESKPQSNPEHPINLSASASPNAAALGANQPFQGRSFRPPLLQPVQGRQRRCPHDRAQTNDQVRVRPGQRLRPRGHERARLRAAGDLHPVRHLLRPLPVEHFHGLYAPAGDGADALGLQAGGPAQHHHLALRLVLRLHGRMPETDPHHRHHVRAQAAGHPRGNLSRSASRSRCWPRNSTRCRTSTAA